MQNSTKTRDKYKTHKKRKRKKSDINKMAAITFIVFIMCIVVYLYLDVSTSADSIVAQAQDMDNHDVKGKSDFYLAYMDVSIDTGRAAGYSQTASSLPVSITGTGIDSGIILNEYLRLYDGPTITSETARVVNVGVILDAASISRYTWSMGEGYPKDGQDFANKYAFTELGGNLTRANCDATTQTIGGRYLVAVGPGIMVENYASKYISSSDMNYGTSIDIVILDDMGKEYYIPCVVADAKVHTYGNGVYQTGISIDSAGNLDDQSANHADGSVVEFCTKTANVTGEEISSYAIDKIIVYEGSYN